MIECPTCEGSGRINPPDRPGGPIPCPKCEAAGYIDSLGYPVSVHDGGGR